MAACLDLLGRPDHREDTSTGLAVDPWTRDEVSWRGTLERHTEPRSLIKSSNPVLTLHVCQRANDVVLCFLLLFCRNHHREDQASGRLAFEDGLSSS